MAIIKRFAIFMTISIVILSMAASTINTQSNSILAISIPTETTIETIQVIVSSIPTEAIETVLPTQTSVPSTPTPTSSVSTKVSYTAEDLDLLARLIQAEAGADYCSDEQQLLVGNVVLNRVASSGFPNTIRGVIYQSGQYACVTNGMIKRTPTARAIANAKRLLEGERFCPSNILFQAEFKQSKGVWKAINNGHTTTYFCY